MGIQKYYNNCIRQRKTEVLNDRGRPISTYIDTPIKGYLSEYFRQQETNQAGKDTVETFCKFFTNDFELLQFDIIIYNNQKYEVLNDPKNTANKRHHLKAILRKVSNIKQ